VHEISHIFHASGIIITLFIWANTLSSPEGHKYIPQSRKVFLSNPVLYYVVPVSPKRFYPFTFDIAYYSLYYSYNKSYLLTNACNWITNSIKTLK
jgi:hypothetical protein